MQVKVNGRPVELFAGAKVEDALRRFSRAEWTKVRKGLRTVRDGRGNEVALDGELSGGETLTIRHRPPKEPLS